MHICMVGCASSVCGDELGNISRVGVFRHVYRYRLVFWCVGVTELLISCANFISAKFVH